MDPLILESYIALELLNYILTSIKGHAEILYFLQKKKLIKIIAEDRTNNSMEIKIKLTDDKLYTIKYSNMYETVCKYLGFTIQENSFQLITSSDQLENVMTSLDNTLYSIILNTRSKSLVCESGFSNKLDVIHACINKEIVSKLESNRIEIKSLKRALERSNFENFQKTTEIENLTRELSSKDRNYENLNIAYQNLTCDFEMLEEDYSKAVEKLKSHKIQIARSMPKEVNRPLNKMFDFNINVSQLEIEQKFRDFMYVAHHENYNKIIIIKPRDKEVKKYFDTILNSIFQEFGCHIVDVSQDIDDRTITYRLKFAFRKEQKNKNVHSLCDEPKYRPFENLTK